MLKNISNALVIILFICLFFSAPGVQAAWDVWSIDDTVKVRPDQTIVNTNYSTANPNYKNSNMVWNGTSATIHGARNEYVAFQVIIEASGESLTGASVTVSDLVKGGDTISSSNIELFREAYIEVTTPSTPRDNASGSSAGVGWYPDALIPMYPDAGTVRSGYNVSDFATFNVSDNQCQAVWVDVYIPKTAVIGDYTATITVSADGKTDITVPLNLTVWDFDIPDEPSLLLNWRLYRFEIGWLYETVGAVGPGGSWVSFDWQQHTTDWDYSKQFFQVARKHRAEMTTGFTRPIRTIDGSGNLTNIDWTYFDSTFGTFLDGSGYDDGIPNKVWETGLGGGGDNPFSGQDMTYWNNYYPQSAGMWADHFQSKGWLDQIPYTYFTDEPSITEYQNLDLVSRLINTGSNGRVYFMVTEQAFPLDPVDEFYSLQTEQLYGPDLFTRENSFTGETSVDYPNWTGDADTKIDIWIPNGRFYFPTDPYVKGTAATIKAAGDLAWVYQGAGEPWIGNTLIDDNGLACRTWAWMGWKYQVDGMYVWSANYWEKSTDSHANLDAVYTNPNTWGSGTNTYNGDGVLFYPGHQVGLTTPVVSFRMKAFRRGMSDYEYMRLLELLTDKAFADSTVDNIVTRGFNYFNPPTTLSSAASAGDITISVADKSYIGSSSSIIIKGNIEAEDEVRTVTASGTMTLNRALDYSHNNGNAVGLRYAPYSWRPNFDVEAKWSKNPEDWYTARQNMAAQIKALYDAGNTPDLTEPQTVSAGSISVVNGANEGEVVLSWTAPYDDEVTEAVTSYEIRYGTSPIANSADWGAATLYTGSITPQAPGSGESITIAGLYGSTTYYFAIRSDDEVGHTSAISTNVNLTLPPDTTAPAVPANLSKLVQGTTVTLTWDDVTDGDFAGYNIYRGTVSGGPYTKLNTTLKTTNSYIDTSLAEDTYYYVVTSNDVSSNESSYSNEVNVLIAQASFDLTNVWVIDDSVKVRPDQTLVNQAYSASNPTFKDSNMVWNRGTNTTSLHGAKNEYVAFQVIVEANNGFLTGVSASVGDLTRSGGGTIAASNIELFREAYIEVTTPSTPRDNKDGSSAGAGWYPDALIPMYPDAGSLLSGYTADSFSSFDITNNECQAVWVDIFIPKTALSGTYTGTLTLTAPGETDITTNITLNVWDFTVPDKPSLIMNWRLYRFEIGWLFETVGAVGPGGSWVSFDWGKHTTDWDLTKQFFEVAHKHRAQTTVGFTRPERTLNNTTGEISNVDWTYFDNTFGTFLDGSGFEDGVPNQVWETDLGNGSKFAFILSAHPMSYFENLYPQTAAIWADHFQSKGWLDRIPYTYFCDEPSPSIYDEVAQVSQMINTASNGLLYFMLTEQAFPLDPVDAQLSTISSEEGAGPDLWSREHAATGETTVAYPGWTGNEDTKIDIWVPNGRFYFPTDPYIPDTAATIKADGDLAWVYQGAGEPWIGNTLIDDIGLACRTWPWMAWKYDVDGMFVWSSNYWEKSTSGHSDLDAVYTNPNTWGSGNNVYNGDGVLFYPGHQVGIDIPITSFRMKAFRRGMTDYEYMKILELIGDNSFADTEVDGIIQRAFNYYAEPTVLTAAAPAGATSISIADTKDIGVPSSILIKGDVPSEDEVRLIAVSGTLTLNRALDYSHSNGNVVALRYAPYSWRATYDADAKWDKDPDTWYQARVDLGNRIVSNGGTPDFTPPAKINTLSVTPDLVNGTAELTWTASGDDGSTGTAASYDIRYSTTDPAGGKWGQATKVSNPPTPAVAGSSESKTVTGLTPGVTYYFRIRVIDDAGWQSDLSNLAPTLTDTTAPFTSGHSPADGASAVAVNTNIVVHVQDIGSGVDSSTIVMTVEGVTVSPTISGSAANYTLTYDPPSDFTDAQVVNVTIAASDLDGNAMTSESYSFTVSASAPTVTTTSSSSSRSTPTLKSFQLCPVSLLLAEYPREKAIYTAFKEKYLEPYPLGREFVKVYYRNISPVLVKYLRAHEEKQPFYSFLAISFSRIIGPLTS